MKVILFTSLLLAFAVQSAKAQPRDLLSCDDASRREVDSTVDAIFTGVQNFGCPSEKPEAFTVADVIDVVARRGEGCQTLRRAAAQNGMTVGSAVQSAFFLDDGYARRFCREFNRSTPENEGKWYVVQAEPGVFSFDGVDAIMDFALKNEMDFRYHNLIWYAGLPSWVGWSQVPGHTNELWSAQERDAIESEHISTVLSHTRAVMQTTPIDIDVANEVVSDSGGFRPIVFWLPDEDPYHYIELAFKTAHAAYPEARLFINDYSVEEVNTKSDALYALVEHLLMDGIPISGVGFQGHLNLDDMTDFSSIAANFQRFAALGLIVQFTEVDVRICGGPASSAQLQQQAVVYGNVFQTCLYQPQCDAVTMWGLDDAHSWIPGFFAGCGAATLFNEQGEPKPAYDAALKALPQE